MASSSTESHGTPPLVSVGCAIYNGEATLPRALDGLRKQTYPNVEFIFCDDGSTDSSRDMCKEFATQRPNVRYIENEHNLGVVGNYNKLIGLARGKYFMWADQDDVRDPTFIEKTAAVLEADEGAVLCHSYTGVFYGPFDHLMHVNTLDYIDGDENVLRRYWRFMRAYSDTTIYGLIRTSALLNTSRWRPDVGSSNSLLFELLLQGSFRQVPETLYYYSAKGARPSPEEELRRSNGERAVVETLRRPFVTLALNQAKGVLHSDLRRWQKAALLAELGNHLALVNGAKATFRTVEALRGKRVTGWFERACALAVHDERDIHLVIGPKQMAAYYDSASALRR